MAGRVRLARICQRGAHRFGRAKAGATSIEYSLVASLIAVVIVGAIALLSGNVSLLYQSVANSFPG